MNRRRIDPTPPPPGFAVFLQVAAQLNRELGVCPVLYGSVGLHRLRPTAHPSADIDILVPGTWLGEGWATLQALMAGLQFVLVDAREHAFRRCADEVAFADEGSLQPFAGIDPARLHTATVAGVCFKELTVQDYLAVYRASHQDGYRRDQRGTRDAAKIAQIEAWLAQHEPGAPNG